MSERIQHLWTAIIIAALTTLSACAARQASVVEKLDEITAVTITHSRTPIIMSPDTPFETETPRDYAQIGVIEVNRMGSLQYYIWLGISDVGYPESMGGHPDGYESIVLSVDGEKFPLDVSGWTHQAIGSSEPLYKKLFRTSTDAYYEVALEQIQLMNDADVIEFYTTGPAPRKFVLWYIQRKAADDLREFLSTVLQ